MVRVDAPRVVLHYSLSAWCSTGLGGSCYVRSTVSGYGASCQSLPVGGLHKVRRTAADVGASSSTGRFVVVVAGGLVGSGAG
jgi:hypothetical protein